MEATPDTDRDVPRETPSLGRVAIPIAFSTVVAMWALGYLSHLPYVPFPRVALVLLVVIQVLGGRAGARRHPARIAAGTAVGALSALLHLLVLGSFLAETTGIAGVPASALIPAWVAIPGQILGFLGLGAILGGVGGGTVRGEEVLPFDGVPVFSRVAAIATFLLVVIGGIVTSSEAGLAVPDWPTSFEANMFLLPFSRMMSEGGVYKEHAHRLFGALVGVTTVALTGYLWRFESRRWVRGFALLAVAAVLAQAVLGGIRVEAAKAGIDTAWSLSLRVAHGVSGQIFFAGLLALVAFTSRSWRSEERLDSPSARTERRLAALLLAVAIGQLFLGALLRHISREWLLPHIGGAVCLASIGILCSVRATGLYPQCPQVRGTGLALLFLIIGQLMLGFLALAVTGTEVRGASTGALEILVATAHQATGALVLGIATLHLIWVLRRLTPAVSDSSEVASSFP